MARSRPRGGGDDGDGPPPGRPRRPPGDGPENVGAAKVDRVRSAQEAAAVEALGADLVAVALGPDPRFDDYRTVTVDEAAVIGNALQRAQLVAVLETGDDAGRVLRIVGAAGGRLVQPAGGVIPPPGVRAALSDAGIGIVYAGTEIAHDDDPGWVFSRYADTPDLNASLFQADVLPEYRASWAFLRDRAPEYDDEFQVADLEELGTKFPLVVGLDFTPENTPEIIAALPSVRGIVLTLADRARRNDARFHPYAEALRVLQAR